jgi:hypothetical protein
MTSANGYKRSKRVHRRPNSVPPEYVLKGGTASYISEDICFCHGSGSKDWWSYADEW